MIFYDHLPRGFRQAEISGASLLKQNKTGVNLVNLIFSESAELFDCILTSSQIKSAN